MIRLAMSGMPDDSLGTRSGVTYCNRSVGSIRHRLLLVPCLVLCVAVCASAQEPPPVAPVASPPPFEVWLAELRAEALSRGFQQELVDRALGDLQPVAQILERDRTQAEFTLDLDAYLRRRLTRETVRTAQQMYSRHRPLLQKIGKQYGVSPRIVVAVWGLESSFGRFAGARPTIPTLATLAYDPRRSALFRSELFNALEIVKRGDVDLAHLKGSWAGALGQPQFLPSSYLKYAQDFDGDGRRDIWTSSADVFASVAFYLRQHGWSDGMTWGLQVRVPAKARKAVDALPRRSEGCRAERLLTEPKPLSEWRKLGLKTSANRALPNGSMLASLVSVGNRDFLVYANYGAILGYNCAHSYAMSVGLLADRLH
jgi:membrane-bound lytic murein transglycosylase B